MIKGNRPVKIQITWLTSSVVPTPLPNKIQVFTYICNYSEIISFYSFHLQKIYKLDHLTSILLLLVPSLSIRIQGQAHMAQLSLTSTCLSWFISGFSPIHIQVYSSITKFAGLLHDGSYLSAYPWARTYSRHFNMLK